MISTVKELLWPAMEQLETRQATGRQLSGLATGFPDLDELTGGFRPGDLVIVSGAPGMGKSSLALHFTLAALSPAHAPESAVPGSSIPAIVPMEMHPLRYIERMLAREALRDRHRITSGRLRDDDYPRLAMAAGHLNHLDFYFIHSPRLTVDDLCKEARELKDGPGLDLLIVDPLNLLRVQGFAPPASNREQEVGIIVRELKALAIELSIPVIATATLSRAREQRFDKRPMLSDLRDSGDIENTADLVLFLYRPEYYLGPTDKDGNSLEGIAEVIVAKHREGFSPSYVTAYFHPESGRFIPRGRYSED